MVGSILSGLLLWTALAFAGLRFLRRLIRARFAGDERGDVVIRRVTVLFRILFFFMTAMGCISMVVWHIKFGE
jgi:hypothetical protein